MISNCFSNLNLKLGLQNQSLLWDKTFVSNLLKQFKFEALFPTCYYLCLQNRRFDSGIEASLRERVQIRSFFWSAFSWIWTEEGDLQNKSTYSVRIQENMNQKKLRIWTLFTQCFVSGLKASVLEAKPWF